MPSLAVVERLKVKDSSLGVVFVNERVTDFVLERAKEAFHGCVDAPMFVKTKSLEALLL